MKTAFIIVNHRNGPCAMRVDKILNFNVYTEGQRGLFNIKLENESYFSFDYDDFASAIAAFEKFCQDLSNLDFGPSPIPCSGPEH